MEEGRFEKIPYIKKWVGNKESERDLIWNRSFGPKKLYQKLYQVYTKKIRKVYRLDIIIERISF